MVVDIADKREIDRTFGKTRSSVGILDDFDVLEPGFIKALLQVLDELRRDFERPYLAVVADCAG